MIKIESDLSNEIIKNFVPANILSLKPIIAGGFALSLYLTCKSAENNLVKNIVIHQANKNKSLSFKFSDIDIWFHENNPNLDQIKEWFLTDVPNHAHILPSSQLTKNTVWANTFHLSQIFSGKNNANIIQFIKRQPKSIEDLISNFDLKICSIAWHDGHFYLLDDLEDNFISRNMELNNVKKIKRQKFGSKVFQSLRYFKYHERYGLEFSREMFDFIIELMSMTSDFLDKTEKQDKGTTVKITSSNGNYTEDVVGTDSMKRMCNQLLSEFEKLSKMSHWTPATPLFLANSKHINIQRYLTVEPQKKTLDLDNLFNDLLNF